MSNGQHVRDDGGYGNSSLVGSDRSGLRSAIEGRRAEEAARRHTTDDAAMPRSASRSRDDTLGRAAEGDGGRRVEGPDSSAGIGTGASLSERTDLSDRGGADELED